MRVSGVMTAALLGAALGVWAQEVPLRETPQGTLFGTESFAVRLDARTGWAGEVLCNGQVVVKAADTRQCFDLRQGDSWVTGDGSGIQGLGVERLSPDTIRSRMKVGDWSLDACLQIFPDARMLRRWFEIAWQGASDTQIKSFWIQGGVLPLGGNGSYFLPAQYPPHRTTTKDLVADRTTYSGRSPCPVIGDTGGGWSAVWVIDELPSYADFGSAAVREGGGQIRVTQSFNMQGHMRKGVPQKVGDAWLWLQPNDSETALCRLGEWFRRVGQVPPEGRPDWIKRAILYSFHPGGTIGSECRDLGGFQAATALLPQIRALGCNAIWLMPLEDQSIYCPRDYYKFQEGLGTADDYKALTAKAHALGMRVWQDCVPHGGRNDFPRAQAHPEWLVQNEDGSTLHYWCFDFNWPTWIEYMGQVASFYTREYGLDGFRIDAVSGSYIPNWNPAIPYARASQSQSQGGLAMQRALRAAVRGVRPDGATLAETGMSIHGATSDSIYDFDLCYSVLHDFRRASAEEFATRLRRWLHEQQYAEVPDLMRLRHVESHDSLRSGLWYGVAGQRALVALLAWIPGIPLVYHEMEEGNVEAFQQIFRTRSCVAELNAGSADYLSVAAPAGVFACLRTGALPQKGDAAWSEDYAWDAATKGAERASVVLVSLSGKPVNGEVAVPLGKLPEGLRSVGEARDLLSGEKVKVRQGVARVSLPPLGYTVLRFGGAALPQAAERRPARKSPSPSYDGTLTVKGKSGTLRIDPATGLATVWQEGRRVLACRMDLALPPGLADAAAKTTVAEKDGGVETVRAFGAHALTLRYAPAGDGVDVRATWQGGTPEGAALTMDVPGAETWCAQTAEGFFRSPFRVRHAACDGVVGSIYRLPQGTSVVWDSRLHPFGLSTGTAWVGASIGGRETVFGFDPGALPAAVQVLDRVGDEPLMKVLMAWRSEEEGLTLGGDALVFRLGAREAKTTCGTDTGDARLSVVGGGWEFQNGDYRARVTRSGALAGVWRKEGTQWRQVMQSSRLYTDRGFQGDKTFRQDNDMEATARIERRGDEVRMSFAGELRGFERFEKMRQPVRFCSTYAFDNGPAFRRMCAYDTDYPVTADFAYLSLIASTEGFGRAAFADGAGEFLAGERGDGKARSAQTAQAADPARLPRDIRLFAADGSQLRLGDLKWIGAPPANVFLHGDDVHVAWMDGKPGSGSSGQWNGVSMSVSCSDAAVAAKDEAALKQRAGDALVRDGGFERMGGGAVLLVAQRTMPDVGRQPAAWQLPNGAEAVAEGGNRCLSVTGDGAEYRMIQQTLAKPAFPAGSKWRLSARMKGVGVQKSDVEWKTACLRWRVRASGQTQYFSVSLAFGDSEWREVSAELTVPTGLEEIAVEAGLNGNRGRVWIDDVVVTRVDK